MKKTFLFLAAIMTGVLLTGCGSSDDSEDSYKGIKLSKKLMESVLNYYGEVNLGKVNENSCSIHNCGECIELNSRGVDAVIMNENGDTIVVKGEDRHSPYIGEFSNGLAAVVIGIKIPVYEGSSEYRIVDKWRLLRSDGTFVRADEEFSYIGPWMAGNAYCFKESQVGVINDRGETVVEFGKYPVLIPIDNGLIIAQGNNGYGFLDNNGKELGSFDYEAVIYENGFLMVKKDAKFGLVDKNAKVVLPVEYDQIKFEYIQKNELAKVYKSDKCGLVNKNGEFAIPCEYENVSECSSYDGYEVMKNGKVGVVDFSNKEKWPFEFDMIYTVGNDIIDVKKDGRRGVLNRKGEWLDVPNYMFGAPIYGDLLLKKDNEGICGAVNAKGETVIPFEFYSIEKCGAFLRTFQRGGYYGVYSFEGKEISPCKDQGVDCYGDYVIWGTNTIETKGVERKDGKNIVPHEYWAIISYDNFFEATGEKKGVAFYSKDGKFLHGHYDSVLNFSQILNGYSFLTNDKLVFMDDNGDFLFDLNLNDFNIQRPDFYYKENYLKEDQMKIMRHLLDEVETSKKFSNKQNKGPELEMEADIELDKIKNQQRQ